MKLSFNKVQESGQCHTATKWQSKNSDLGHTPYLQHNVNQHVPGPSNVFIYTPVHNDTLIQIYMHREPLLPENSASV